MAPDSPPNPALEALIARLGGLNAQLHLIDLPEELNRLRFDPARGFLFGELYGGPLKLSELLATSPLPPQETLEFACQLLHDGWLLREPPLH